MILAKFQIIWHLEKSNEIFNQVQYFRHLKVFIIREELQILAKSRNLQ